MVRVRSQYIIVVVLSVSVAAMAASVLVPARSLMEDDQCEERGETFGTDAARFRMMKLAPRFGRVPPDAYVRAKAQVDLRKWGGAARRLESTPAAPIDPQ